MTSHEFVVRRALLLAAVVALGVSSCGGGDGAASTQRSASSTASRPVGRSAAGSFHAAIPSGWRSGMAAAATRGYRPLYAAIGPSAGGVAADVIVTRAPAGSLTAGAMAAFALAGLHRQTPPNQGISPARRLTVDGAPAVAVDYTHLAAPGRRVFHETVDVLHGGWLYIVTCTGARATAVTGPLGAILSSWRWS